MGVLDWLRCPECGSGDRLGMMLTSTESDWSTSKGFLLSCAECDYSEEVTIDTEASIL